MFMELDDSQINLVDEADASADAGVTESSRIGSPGRFPDNHYIRALVFAAVVLGGSFVAVNSADGKPKERTKISQVSYDHLSEDQLLDEIRGLLGRNVVDPIVSPRRISIVDGSSYLYMPILGLEDGYARQVSEYDNVSPADKLAKLKKERAEKIKLIDQLKPYLQAAKKKGYGWSGKFDKYLQIPDEPNVPFSEGRFAKFTNKDLLKQLSDVLGEDVVNSVVSSIVSPRRGFVVDGGSYRYIPIGGLLGERHDRKGPEYDDVSPADKLAKLKKERAEKTAVAKELKPIIEEGRRRGVFWAKSSEFNRYLQIPDEPNVPFSRDKFSAYSNRALLAHVEKGIGFNFYSSVAFADPDFLKWREGYPFITKKTATSLKPFVEEAKKRQLTWAMYLDLDSFVNNNAVSREEVPAGFVKTRKMQDLEAKIGRYGIKVYYEYSQCSDRDRYTAVVASSSMIERNLEKLLKFIPKYPESVRKRFKGLEVCLVKDLKLRSGHGIDGFGGGGSLGLDVNSFSEDVFCHEIFHELDSSDGSRTDDMYWIPLNPDGVHYYEHESGVNSISRGCVAERRSNGKDPEGAANWYGKCGGVSEDQATIHEDMHDPKTAGRLMERARTDEVLRNKMEFQTGCVFDPKKGRFVREFTEKEYMRKFGTRDFEYFAKWARDKSGKLRMGVNYWNSIADKSGR